MDNERIFFILNSEEKFEIILRAFLSKNDLYSEINFIFTSLTFIDSIIFSQIFSTKLKDDLYKLEIEISGDISKKKQICDIISNANYKDIS